MIRVLEKDFLNDSFIQKVCTKNICLNDRMNFNNKDIYYFGNYSDDKIDLIKNKLLKNKKRIINAIENNAKFIVCGNSYDILNNSFNKSDLNIYTAYNKKMFKKRRNKLLILKDKINLNVKRINSLDKVIDDYNFKYKNLICIKDEFLLNKIIKKTKQTTLSC